MNAMQLEAIAAALHQLADALSPPAISVGVPIEVLVREIVETPKAPKAPPSAKRVAKASPVKPLVDAPEMATVAEVVRILDYDRDIQPRALVMLQKHGVECVRGVMLRFGLKKNLKEALPEQLPELAKAIETAIVEGATA
jgi:hypothetical protein